MERLQGPAVPQTLQDACDPQNLALLVYDMQISRSVCGYGLMCVADRSG